MIIIKEFAVYTNDRIWIIFTGKRGGKGKKGKGKRGGKKKGKKPPKKFARLMFEEEYIWNKGRGELEVIAETLQRQVTIERSERIRFAYEREWLFEMTKVYLQKIREVRVSLYEKSIIYDS